MGARAPIALIGTLPMYQKNAAIDASHTMHGKIQLIFPLLNGVIVKLAKVFINGLESSKDFFLLSLVPLSTE